MSKRTTRRGFSDRARIGRDCTKASVKGADAAWYQNSCWISLYVSAQFFVSLAASVVSRKDCSCSFVFERFVEFGYWFMFSVFIVYSAYGLVGSC